MLKYAVVEIAGRQYKIEPGQKFRVNFLGDLANFECDKVLLVAEGDKVSIGNPYCSEKLKFKVEQVKEPKVRISTYKAKANTRKTIGMRAISSLLQLV